MDQKELELREEYKELQERMQSSDIYSSKDYPTLARRQGELDRVVALFDKKKSLEAQLAEAKKMTDDEELAQLASDEIISLDEMLGQVQALSPAPGDLDMQDQDEDQHTLPDGP